MFNPVAVEALQRMPSHVLVAAVTDFLEGHRGRRKGRKTRPPSFVDLSGRIHVGRLLSNAELQFYSQLILKRMA